MKNNVLESVQEYYGEELQTNGDLKTTACCTLSAPPKYISEILDDIHEEVKSKYYGCGLSIPPQMEGLKILDLGSGSGRDCFIASKLVGPNGMVIGIDATDQQLDVANKYIDCHTEKFGFKTANIKFLKGNIEKLDQLNLEPGSFDLIISNCVINLVNDKSKVLKDAYQLLKPGGEMFFSDIISDRRIPEHVKEDKVLWGECLAGAVYWNDFLNIAKSAGFGDPRTMGSNPVAIEDEEIQQKVGDANFFSVTYRLLKIDGLESDCEDYGQAVRYLGTIENSGHSFDLDDHHHFPKGKMITVCGNTYMMLKETRFRPHFEFFGNFSTHYGIFEGCGGAMPFILERDSDEASCC